jgi:hypothetical protein
MKSIQIEADKAFAQAIASGRLSLDSDASNYVGHYMYMGPAIDPKRGGAFKHRDTRQYIS